MSRQKNQRKRKLRRKENKIKKFQNRIRFSAEGSRKVEK